jgi:hypothetical protein
MIRETWNNRKYEREEVEIAWMHMQRKVDNRIVIETPKSDAQ